MKTIINLLFIFIIQSSFAQNWIQVSNFPATQRDDACTFTIGPITYCGSGLSPWYSPLADFYAFNSFDENWHSISSMPDGKERQYAVGFAHDDMGYVFGGSNANGYLNDLWRFDPTLNQWDSISSLPVEGRSGACSFVIGDTAYIIGGKSNSSNALATVWAYHFTSNSWQQKNDLPFSGIWRGSSVSNQDYGYLLFGKNEFDVCDSVLHQYDPAADAWLMLSEFPLSGRYYADLQIINDVCMLALVWMIKAHISMIFGHTLSITTIGYSSQVKKLEEEKVVLVLFIMLRYSIPPVFYLQICD